VRRQIFMRQDFWQPRQSPWVKIRPRRQPDCSPWRLRGFDGAIGEQDVIYADLSPAHPRDMIVLRGETGINDDHIPRTESTKFSLLRRSGYEGRTKFFVLIFRRVLSGHCARNLPAQFFDYRHTRSLTFTRRHGLNRERRYLHR
jgi:hypothetical protein